MQRVDSLEKTLMLGGIGGRRRRGWQRMRWLDGITDLKDMRLSKLQEMWWTGRLGMLWFMGSQGVRHDWATELNWNIPEFNSVFFSFWTLTLLSVALSVSCWQCPHVGNGPLSNLRTPHFRKLWVCVCRCASSLCGGVLPSTLWTTCPQKRCVWCAVGWRPPWCVRTDPDEGLGHI